MNEKLAELLLILIGLLGLMLARGVLSHFPEHVIPNKPTDSVIEQWTLFTLTAIALGLLPFIDLFLPWLDFADLPFSKFFAWLGVCVGLLAIGLFLQALLDSIRYRSRPDIATFSAGIYRFVRHPIYSVLLLWSLVQFALLQNWLAGAIALSTILAIYAWRSPRDEMQMLERFGHRYLDYMERTGSLFPRWRNVRSR